MNIHSTAYHIPFLALICSIVLSSCADKPAIIALPNDYTQAYIQTTGLQQERCDRSLCIEVLPHAPDYILARELDRGLHTEKGTAKQRRKDLNYQTLVELHVSAAADGKLPEGFQLQQAQLSLETKQGETPCALLHTENEAGLRPYQLYYAVFDIPFDSLGTFTVQADLPNSGILRFHYTNELIQHLPLFQPKR